MPPPLVFRIADAHLAALERAGVGDLEGLLRADVGETVKHARSHREVRRLESDGCTYFLKRVLGDGWKEVVHEAEMLAFLHGRGIPVAEPVAIAAKDAAAAMVSTSLPGQTTVEKRVIDAPVSLPEQRELADRIADVLRALHAAGVNHRDFYLGHLILADDGSVSVVDFGRAERRRKVPRRRIVKDLAALDFSTPGRVASPALRWRFLRRYAGPDATRRTLRRLAAAVRRKSARLRAHAERKLARGDGNVHVNR
ncbi:MAG: hypothetical protein CMJ83_09320 [Planctomycetes bacterium]|nr:hypothetical protein [Planctomycetota bacterium]